MRNIFLFFYFMASIISKAQLPIEFFIGHEMSTIDVTFFVYFKNIQSKNSPFLFFNRTRAAIDYRMTDSTNLPQFSFTQAVSYNKKIFRGVAPVAIIHALNKSLFAKLGFQFAYKTKNKTFFTWFVCQTKTHPSFDYFVLFRYMPKLVGNLNLFIQAESVNTIPTFINNKYSLTERLRLGLGIKSYQFGLGTDLNQTGRVRFSGTYNVGIFLRNEF